MRTVVATEDQTDRNEGVGEPAPVASPAPLSFALDVDARETRERAAVVVETFFVGRFRDPESVLEWTRSISGPDAVTLPNDYYDLLDLHAFLSEKVETDSKAPLQNEFDRVRPFILRAFEARFTEFSTWYSEALSRIKDETDVTDEDRAMLPTLKFFKDIQHPFLGELSDFSMGAQISNLKDSKNRSVTQLESFIEGSFNRNKLEVGVNTQTFETDEDEAAEAARRKSAVQTAASALPFQDLSEDEESFIREWLESLEDIDSDVDMDTAVTRIGNLDRRLRTLIDNGVRFVIGDIRNIAELNDAMFERKYMTPVVALASTPISAPEAPREADSTPAPVVSKAPSPRRRRVWGALRALAAGFLMAYSGPAHAPDLPEPMVAASVAPASVGMAQAPSPEALNVSLEKSPTPEKAPTLYDAVRQSTHDQVEAVTNQMVEGATDLPDLAHFENAQDYADLIDILKSWGSDSVQTDENGVTTTTETYGGYSEIVRSYEAGRTLEDCSIQGLIDYAYAMDADGSVGRLLEHNIQMIPRFSQDPLKLKGKVAELIEKTKAAPVENVPASVDPTDAPDWNPALKQSSEVPAATGMVSPSPEVAPTPYMDPFDAPEPVTLLAKQTTPITPTPVEVEEYEEEVVVPEAPAPTPTPAPVVEEKPKGWFSRVKGWFK